MIIYPQMHRLCYENGKAEIIMISISISIRGVLMNGTGSKRESKFKCKICRMIFESKEELKFHMMEEHNNKG